MNTSSLPTSEGVEFKIIPDCHRYAAGNDGSIWSFWTGAWRKMKPSVASCGYMQVSVYNKGRTRSVSVHRLVLLAFRGHCPAGMNACHWNGVKTDNTLSNLRWDTCVSNQLDKRRHGTLPLGERHHNAVLTAEKVDEIRRLNSSGVSSRKTAKILCVSRGAVQHVLSGRTWANR